VKRFGKYGGWKRQECNQHQVEDIQQQQRFIHADDVVKHSMVVNPDCADHHKAHHVSKVGQSKLEACCPKRCIRWWHFNFQYQQSGGDRKNTVAKCPQTGSTHAHLLCQ
jgi:hypothetical protein